MFQRDDRASAASEQSHSWLASLILLYMRDMPAGTAPSMDRYPSTHTPRPKSRGAWPQDTLALSRCQAGADAASWLCSQYWSGLRAVVGPAWEQDTRREALGAA